jgi:hypothetical protein
VQARTRTFCTQGTEISYHAATAEAGSCIGKSKPRLDLPRGSQEQMQ